MCDHKGVSNQNMSPPQLQIPEPLKGSEKGTWAEQSIVERLPAILRRTRDENDFPAAIDERLNELGSEIPEGPICHLRDHHAPDLRKWKAYIAPYQGEDWLQPPWFFVEHYFYRRIMEAVSYFDGGPDPFRRQKEKGLRKAESVILPLASKVREGLKSDPPCLQFFKEMMYLNLWGNQGDLSLWPAESDETPDHTDLDKANDHLLADDSGQAARIFLERGEKQLVVDFLIDNAGFELVSDLAFADLILSGGWASKVRFHVKRHPTFVSDAVVKDVEHTISVLSASKRDRICEFGNRLQGHAAAARLTLHPDFFWNSPLAFWDLPERLVRFLGQADLLVSKGDANYRRLLGDRRWNFQLPFDSVVDYLPASLVALRVLKADVVVGLTPREIHRARKADPRWMVDGRWGVIQFSPPKGGGKG
jgi:uncharacterized protein with ATP-grasp and redox domains